MAGDGVPRAESCFPSCHGLGVAPPNLQGERCLSWPGEGSRSALVLSPCRFHLPGKEPVPFALYIQHCSQLPRSAFSLHSTLSVPWWLSVCYLCIPCQQPHIPLVLTLVQSLLSSPITPTLPHHVPHVPPSPHPRD